MPKKTKILIVCSGNSCRSPMAEGFLKKYLKPDGDFEIVSAGISAIEGLASTDEAVDAMRKEDIDISSHRSKGFSGELAESAEIILVMAGTHKDFILGKYPQLKDRVFLFKEFAGLSDAAKDIIDPIGQTPSIYEKVRDELKEASLKIAEKLKGKDI